jgi:hypothetical protein
MDLENRLTELGQGLGKQVSLPSMHGLISSLPFDLCLGSYDYRVLPLPGAVTHIDSHKVASWSYDARKKELVTFDEEEIGIAKGRWIRKEGLA